MSIGRNDYQERREAHIEHLEERADKAHAESDAAFRAAHDILSVIPAGQPILVGHHSEKRHRRVLERVDHNMEKGVAAGKKAAYYSERAQAAANNTAISSDDPEAVKRLEEKLSALQTMQTAMKAVNAWYRKYKTLDGCPELTPEMRQEINKMWSVGWCVGIPYPPYELSNNNAEINRIRKRIKSLCKVDEMPHMEVAFDGGIIVTNEGINRVQILFDEKPDENTRAALKHRGFRWSRTEGAWQIGRTPCNFRNACYLLGVEYPVSNGESIGTDNHEQDEITEETNMEKQSVKDWKVQLAKTIGDAPIPAGERFWLTQKCNGVRGTYYQGQIIGRNGRAYTGLEHIINILEEKGLYDFVLDGELTLADPGDLSDSEAFRKAAGLVRCKSGDKSGLALRIFDIIPTDEFDAGRSRVTYAARRELLDKLADRFRDTKTVQILPALYVGTDQSIIEPMLDRMVAEGKEGLIANLDTPYIKKRNSGIVKIKRFDTIDLPIVRCEEGTGANTGKLGAFIVAYHDCEVGVGAGLTQEQREEFWARREELTGKIIEVKYKEESTNKGGGVSLQFPVFVALREDKDDISISRSGAAAMERMAQENSQKPQEPEPETATDPMELSSTPEVWMIGGRKIYLYQMCI